MTENNLIKRYKWLYPLAFLYGIGVNIRNYLYDWGFLSSRSFGTPIISIGNITVGGTGKTPHTEYLIRLLKKEFQVAVLSRGYKRKSKGFILATSQTSVLQIGDEPFQMKQKYPDIHIAVDANRCHGIDELCKKEIEPEVGVILLDDAYQHRRVQPGINILLVDYHRPISEDTLLPAGRLREPAREKHRADIVIITKCPRNIKPIDYRIIHKQMDLFPYQQLFFSTLVYKQLVPLFPEAATSHEARPLSSLDRKEKILLVTGIASPAQLQADLSNYSEQITLLAYPDHHHFTEKDIKQIKQRFEALGEGEKIIITTEKDATRLKARTDLDETLRQHLYVIPIEIEFLQNQQESFNETIIGYVRANSRNSILHKVKDTDRP